MIPGTLREGIATLAILLGFISMIASFRKKWMSHALKVGGLFLLLGLCLFSDSEWSYLAGIFIVATAVTRLDYLQNLIAIIRGNKDYFDYKKEFVSNHEVFEQKLNELKGFQNEEQHSRDDAEMVIASPHTQAEPVQLALIAEEFAFKEIERSYNKPIQRHIRIIGDSQQFEFDGLIELSDACVVCTSKVIPHSPFPFEPVIHSIDRLLQQSFDYKKLLPDNKKLIVTFVIVNSFEEGIKNELKEKLADYKSAGASLGIEFELLLFSFADLGLYSLETLES